ncbi:MAG: histidine triad nucleotide-binding protein [bacterium]
MENCIFCKILKKEIPGKLVYEDDQVAAFNDIAPQAPTHILIIPKQHVDSLADLADEAIMGELFRVAIKLAKDLGLDKQGFRTVINNGKAAGQAVDHLHVHLLGGRAFDWPPG